jgi:hypothetical protein
VKPDTVMRVWSGQGLVELRQHRFLVLRVFHVDEVGDDDAAQVAQAQLAGNGLRRFEVGLEDGVVEIARADVAAGVDVDGGHRLGLVEDQVAARLEVDPARQRLLDFLLDAVQVEQRPLAGVVHEAAADLRHVLLGEVLQLLEVLARVDDDACGFAAHQVAQHALRQRQVVVQQHGRQGADAAALDLAPDAAQVGDVGRQFLVAGLGPDGAQDVAAGLVGGSSA